jgi:hypothetical protein
MIGFRYPSGSEHWISLLVDHVLGDIAKDVTVGAGSVEAIIPHWSETADIELIEVSIGEAAGRMLYATDVTSLITNAPVSSDYGELIALVRARAQRLAEVTLQPEEWCCERRKQVVRDFLEDAVGKRYAKNERAWFLLDVIVDYRCEQVGEPLRWSPGAVALFLLDFVPRKITASRETLEMAGEVLAAWILWAGRRAGLGADQTDKALAVIDELGAEALAALADRSPLAQRAQ